MKISKLFSHNFSVLRQKKGLSIIDVANKCDVSRQAIYNLENGTLPTPALLEKICRLFKIEEHELYQLNDTVK